MKQDFRYDIGALRAFAVLIVVLYHLDLVGFNGGFLGVDVFFVISGFLMTKIVLGGFEKNNFSILDFYNRRFQRIIPALLLMLILVVSVSYFFYFPKDFESANKNALSSSLFLSNIFYALNSGYFHPSSLTNPFLHTWSLSVEWQFYMAYPLMLMLLKHSYLKNRKLFNILFITLAFLSIFSMLFFNYGMDSKYTKFVFFLTPFRAWEMMLGGVVYLYQNKLTNAFSENIKRGLVYISYVGLLLTLIFYNEAMLWPSIYTILPVFFTLGIIAFNVNFSWLKTKIIQYFGNISYSLYLWHWPLIVLYRYNGQVTSFGYIVIFVLSIILSHISYVLIERKISTVSSKKVIGYSTLLILMMVCSVVVNPINLRFPKEIVSISEFRDSYERNTQFNIDCHSDNLVQLEKNGCFVPSTIKRNVFLFGDSHAAHFSYSLNKALTSSDYYLVQVTTSGALPLINTRGQKDPKRVVDHVLKNYLPNNVEQFDLVIISAHWYNYKLRGYTLEEFLEAMQALEVYLKGLKINYVILGQNQFYRVPFPHALASNLYQKREINYVIEEGKSLNFEIRNRVQNYIDIYEFNYKKHQGKDLFMFDDNHLTIWGTEQIVPFILSQTPIKVKS